MFKRKVEEIYDSLFFTHCVYCKCRIIVDIPHEFKRMKAHGAFACNQCVSENSCVRNDIDESSFTDISKTLWNE